MKTFIFCMLFSIAAIAQQKDYSSDVTSPEAITAALYNTISGDPGQGRDWDRFRNLFKPESRLIPTRKGETGELSVKALPPDEYIQLFSSRIATGFFEKEVHRIAETYGTVTHVFSTYETREKKDGPVTNRGINSIQLFHDGKRFYIINIFWCSESMGFPLPKKYVR